MRLTKYGHSCLLVETGDARVLLDPGGFSSGFEDLEGLTAILVTHQHPDHVDADALPRLLDRNPEATLYADEGSAAKLRDDAGIDATATSPGDVLDVGCRIEVGSGIHAEIHPDIPRIPNVGYLIDGRLWHPGDSLVAPDTEVEILALPTVAPWMRIAMAIDFYREVAPRVAVPIHDAITTVPAMYRGMLTDLGPERSELRSADEAPLEF